jgi:predicted transcriptional regulator
VLVIDPSERPEIIKALANEVRVSMLKLLRATGPKNVNQIADELQLPQSTASAHVQILEAAGLISTVFQKARKGSQKICANTFTAIRIVFRDDVVERRDD